MNKGSITIHGALVCFIGILHVASPQLDEGNYIVPKATLDLRHTNRSSGGRKKPCVTNADCARYEHNPQCCLADTGFKRCRKRCKQHKPVSGFRTRRGRRKYITRMVPKARDKVCNMGGKTYKEGQKMEVEEGCKQCICNKGSILCTNVQCSFSDQRVCIVEQKVYHEGQKVKAKDGCNKCVCNKGTMLCTNRPCPPAKCSYKGGLYDDGYHLILGNGCKRCICQKKNWSCTSHPCRDFNVGNVALAVIPSILVAALSTLYSIYSVWLS